MDSKALMARAARERNRYVDGTAGLVANHSPNEPGDFVAQGGTAAAREYGSEIPRIIRLNGPYGVDTAIQRSQPAGCDTVVDEPSADPGCDKLFASHDAVWAGQRADLAIQCIAPG